MHCPELAVVVSTFERPWHLKRALLSIALQRGVAGKFEVVVTDDGSRDETRQVVERFSRKSDFPVWYTTHPHDGFRLACCRNEGISVSTAPYLLFTDGDCLLPPEHLTEHLKRRRPGLVIAGDCYRLDPSATEQVDESAMRSAKYLKWVHWRERLRIANKARRALIYGLFRHPLRPRLTGCNIGVWREDLERVNGFDENYIGWGLEDRDLQLRLGRLGLRFKTILHKTAAYHLWHPPHPTFARNGKGTPNLHYYQRGEIPIWCRNGLVKWDQVGTDTESADEELAGMVLPFPAPVSTHKRVAA